MSDDRDDFNTINNKSPRHKDTSGEIIQTESNIIKNETLATLPSRSLNESSNILIGTFLKGNKNASKEVKKLR